MAAKSDYVTGTITLTNGATAFTGTDTGWLLAGFAEGDEIKQVEGQTQWEAMVATITDNTHGTLVRPWGGATGTYAYRMRYQADGQRVTAQARNLIELLGDGTLLSLAGLVGPGVIELLAGGGAQVVPKTDLVSGANYDVQVGNPADRSPYDSQLEGYAVLVSDMGDGRAAITSRVTATAGVWSDPAYVTGPVGPLPDIEIGATETLAPGSDATVTPTPITGGVSLTFGIPAGRGPVAKGAYNPVTAYVLDDAVLDNGSTWIALGPTTGNAPPVLPTTSNAFWQLLARKGTDGTGTGDVVGPAVAVDGRLAAADGATGKLIKFLTSAEATAGLAAVVGDSGLGGTKGLVPAPSAGDAAASKFLMADGSWKSPLGTTGAIQLPAGTTAQRPASPTSGMIRYNSTEDKYEVFRGGNWEVLNTSVYPYNINVVLVAGGAAGPSDNTGNAGGGGGGGVLESTVGAVPGTAYAIVIGAGGAQGVGAAAGNGSNTTMTGMTAVVGGGRGGFYTAAALAGGSGGGGGQGSGVVGAGTAGQGNAGGTTTSNAAGGGGGAGAVGGVANVNNGGVGGDGKSTAEGTFGGGGGGANHSAGTGTANVGGSGGGGTGKRASTPATAGAVNTGGGGGGGGESVAGAAGGSGKCVISYPGAQKGTGGTVTSVVGRTIHTFTGSGTFTA